MRGGRGGEAERWREEVKVREQERTEDRRIPRRFYGTIKVDQKSA